VPLPYTNNIEPVCGEVKLVQRRIDWGLYASQSSHPGDYIVSESKLTLRYPRFAGRSGSGRFSRNSGRRFLGEPLPLWRPDDLETPRSLSEDGRRECAKRLCPIPVLVTLSQYFRKYCLSESLSITPAKGPATSDASSGAFPPEASRVVTHQVLAPRGLERQS
jgi:hypothetical protein